MLISLKISPYVASQAPHITNPPRTGPAASVRRPRRVHARPNARASRATGYSQPICGPYWLPSSLVHPVPKPPPPGPLPARPPPRDGKPSPAGNSPAPGGEPAPAPGVAPPPPGNPADPVGAVPPIPVPVRRPAPGPPEPPEV